MLDEDEFEAEVAMFRAPHPPSKTADTRKKRFSDYANEDDEPPPPRSKSVVLKKTSFLLEEDDDDGPMVAPKKPNWGTTTTVAGPVSYRLQEAASLLLGDRRLSRQAAGELTVAYLQKPHEFVTVDPLILVCASVDTGTTRIYCKEVINVSIHWMALALDATFSLQVTPKARTPEEPWMDAVTARPCRSNQVSEHVQPVGALKAVQKAVGRLQVPSNLDQLIERYMIKLGPIDSVTACDPEWAREHVDAFRALCRGQGKVDNDDDDGGSIRDKLSKMV